MQILLQKINFHNGDLDRHLSLSAQIICPLRYKWGKGTSFKQTTYLLLCI